MSAPDARPAPLVPEGVSLGGNEWFPFYPDRLRRSRWWRRASDLARARNVMLWGEAWKAEPAGSLPDDDDELAEAAGFGFDVAAFLAVKPEIMAPWVLCSDDRWYHPTVCETALETWSRTSERRQREKERQAAHRRRIKAQNTDTPEAAPSGSRVTPPNVTRENPLQTDRPTDKPVAAASPLATVEGGKDKASQREPWKADAEFVAVWAAATPQMQRRAKSRAKAFAEWRKVHELVEPGAILAAVRAYRTGDPDVARTGGPGLHIWLRDRTFDTWAASAENPATDWTPERWSIALELWKSGGKWGDTMGPPPGQPGCCVPQAALTAAGLGLRIVGGAA